MTFEAVYLKTARKGQLLPKINEARQVVNLGKPLSREQFAKARAEAGSAGIKRFA